MITNPHNFTCVEYALREVLCYSCTHCIDCASHRYDYDDCVTYKCAWDNAEIPFITKRVE